MSFQGAYVFNSPLTGDASLSVALRDPLLAAPNAGVRFLVDTCFPYSYPGGVYNGRAAAAAPSNGQPVYDIAELANGSFTLGAGQVVSYGGGGFDFSAVTARDTCLSVPASVAADLWTAYGGASQRFLVCGYVKLPTAADFTAGASNYGEIINWSPVGANPELVSIGLNTFAGNQLSVRRGLTAGTVDSALTQVIATADMGGLAQIAVWRNAAGTGVSMKTTRIRTTTTGAVGAANSADFSALTGKVGTFGGNWGVTPNASLRKFRAYRVFVENLARSSRDPITVLDDDWTRVQARITASAAANSGTSIIFV